MTRVGQAPSLVEENIPPVAGSLGIAQGRYGEFGNLELVAADPSNGFWVFWFNGDAVDNHVGAAVGSWSGGLQVPTANAVDAVRISQVRFGPDFLEVVTRSGTSLRRWYWSPTHGFIDTGGLATVAPVDPAAMIAAGARLHTLVAGSDGGVFHLRSETTSYPLASFSLAGEIPVSGSVHSVDICAMDPNTEDLGAAIVAGSSLTMHSFHQGRWVREASPTGRWRSATVQVGPGGDLLVVGTSTAGKLAWATAAGQPGHRWRQRESSIDADAATAALSSLAGGTLEVVWRKGPTIRHARVDPVELAHIPLLEGPVIVSQVWAASGLSSVHRSAVP